MRGLGCIRVNAFGGVHDARARIGGRATQTPISPRIEIVESINDAAAELVIDRPGPIRAMFFQCAAREAKIPRGFGRPKKPRWQTIR